MWYPRMSKPFCLSDLESVLMLTAKSSMLFGADGIISENKLSWEGFQHLRKPGSESGVLTKHTLSSGNCIVLDIFHLFTNSPTSPVFLFFFFSTVHDHSVITPTLSPQYNRRPTTETRPFCYHSVTKTLTPRNEKSAM